MAGEARRASRRATARPTALLSRAGRHSSRHVRAEESSTVVRHWHQELRGCGDGAAAARAETAERARPLPPILASVRTCSGFWHRRLPAGPGQRAPRALRVWAPFFHEEAAWRVERRECAMQGCSDGERRGGVSTLRVVRSAALPRCPWRGRIAASRCSMHPPSPRDL